MTVKEFREYREEFLKELGKKRQEGILKLEESYFSEPSKIISLVIEFNNKYYIVQINLEEKELIFRVNQKEYKENLLDSTIKSPEVLLDYIIDLLKGKYKEAFYINASKNTNLRYFIVEPKDLDRKMNEIKNLIKQENIEVLELTSTYLAHRPDRVLITLIYNENFNKEAELSKAKINIDTIRQWIECLMQKEIVENEKINPDKKISVGINKKPDGLRIDCTPNKYKGVLRSVYSLHSSTGLASVLLDKSEVKSFKKKDATIFKVLEKRNKKKFASLNFYIVAKRKRLLDFFDRAEIGYKGKFGINDHYAQSHHWDLRLEMPDGDLTEFYELSGPEDVSKKEKQERVKRIPKSKLFPKSTFVSFAIPKHRLPGSGKNILIMRTPDHPINYFDRKHPYIIPEGYYGAGKVDLVDKGWYKILDKDDRKKLKIWLNGKEIKGVFDIINTGNNKFLLVKEKKQFESLDEYEKSLEKKASERDDLIDEQKINKISKNYWKLVYKDKIKRWKKLKSRSYYDLESLKEFEELSYFLKNELKRITIHFKINWSFLENEEKQRIIKNFLY